KSAADTRPIASIVQTRTGARYLDGTSAGALRENHRDVFLATFAEAGVPLSTLLNTNLRSSVSLADVLRDSQANFDLAQPEIEWSAIAYALYSPNQAGWRDRDGNVFTFDQLARELLRRDLAKSSCSGAHLLLAMTYLVRVNDDAKCLSSDTREQLGTRLRET